MKTTRFLLAALALTCLGSNAWADNTSIFALSEGWTKVTTMPTASEMEANCYVFVDVNRDLMLGIATGNHQGSDRKGVYYQTCADPTTDLGKLWYIEANGSGYALRNVSYAPVQFNTDYNAHWIYRPTDIADTKGGENSYSKLNFHLNDGKFTLENSRAAESSEKYIGPWDTNNFTNGAECAGNKTDANKGEFYIYSIPRSLVFANKLAGATSASPEDATIAIINPTFDDGNGSNWGTDNYYGGWTKTGTGGNFQCSNGIVESWHQTGFKFSQTINGLPNGSYTLSVQLTDEVSKAFLYAKNATETITAPATIRVTDDGESTYANMKTALEGGTYARVSLDIEVTDGTLEMGIDQGQDGNWMIFDTFKLTYKGKSAFRTAYDEYNELLGNVEQLKDNNTYQYIDNSGAKTTFENAINTANSVVEATTDAATIKTQTANLRAAALSFVSSVTAEDGHPFDLTFLASRDASDWTAVDGDHVAGYVGWALKSNPTPYKFVEAYEQNDQAVGRTGNILTQTLSGMPSGYYTVALYGAACFTPGRGMTEVGNVGDNNRTFGFANNGLPIFHASEIDAPTPVNVSVQLTSAGTLTYGIMKEQAGSNWHVAQIYTITYSKDPDLTVLKADRDALVAEANGVLASEDAGMLTTAQQNALSTAISTAEAANTFDALMEVTKTTLPNAIQTAQQQIQTVKDNRVQMIAALERFENDYNLADGTDYRRMTMSADAWATLLTKVNAVSTALDDVSQASSYGTKKDELIAQMDATDASLRLFKSYKAMVAGTTALNIVGGYDADSNMDTDVTEQTAIVALNTAFDDYATAQTKNFSVSAFLGENLDFSAAGGDAMNTDNSNDIHEVTGWEVDYADADTWAVLQTKQSDNMDKLYIRKNWGSAATTLTVTKEKMLPIGKYRLSFSWDSNLNNMKNLSCYKLGNVSTPIGKATAGTLTYDFTVSEPTPFDVIIGFQKQGTGNTPAQIVADDVTLTYLATNISLADGSDNTATLNTYNDIRGVVTLQNRILEKDNSWNTLCLPFSMTVDQVAAQLAPSALKELDIDGIYTGKQTGFDAENGILYLFFKDAASIEAGKPYLVKWESGEDISNPVFRGVTIDAKDPADVTSKDGLLTFHGVYAPETLTKDDQSRLYLGSDNKLYYPAADNLTINAFRAYFHLDAGIGLAQMRDIVLNFGDGLVTGISSVEDRSLAADESWYTLQGVRLDSKPTLRGIYLRKGRKVVVK